MKLFDLGQNFIRPQLATVAGAAVPSPYGGKILQVQVDLDQEAMQAHNVSADDVLNAISAQNLILPAGDAKIRQIRLERRPQRQSGSARSDQRPSGENVNGTTIYIRDVAFVHEGSPPQTNLVRVNGARAVLMTILKAGSASTLAVIDGIKSRAAAGQGGSALQVSTMHAVGDQSVFVKAAVFGVIREAVFGRGARRS